MSNLQKINWGDVLELKEKLKTLGLNTDAENVYEQLRNHYVVRYFEQKPDTEMNRHSYIYGISNLWCLGLFSNGNVYLFLEIFPPHEKSIISSSRIKFVRKATKEELQKYLNVDVSDLSA